MQLIGVCDDTVDGLDDAVLDALCFEPLCMLTPFLDIDSYSHKSHLNLDSSWFASWTEVLC